MRKGLCVIAAAAVLLLFLRTLPTTTLAQTESVQERILQQLRTPVKSSAPRFTDVAPPADDVTPPNVRRLGA